jgi:RNA-binding protein YlmH
LVSHFLNHVGMWDLLLVPHWWKKKYTIIHPNQIKLNSYFFQLLLLTINLTNCFQPINHSTRIIFFLFINN